MHTPQCYILLKDIAHFDPKQMSWLEKSTCFPPVLTDLIHIAAKGTEALISYTILEAGVKLECGDVNCVVRIPRS